MNITHIFATTAFGAVLLAGCQPAPPPADEPVASTQATTDAPAAVEAPVAPPCGVLAQRDWEAEVSEGSSRTLTVSGVIDLGTPGYGVSLARDAAEASGAATALFTLELRPPSGVQAQVVTAHPVRYFGVAPSAYTAVQINCDGAPLTTIAVGG